MPTPRKDESKDNFISRCIPIVLDEGNAKDNEQATAICNSMWKDKKKESTNSNIQRKFSYKSIMSFDSDDSDIIVKGYIATTHFDGEDIILKDTLEKWMKEINEGNPRSNKVSVNHNRIPHVAGAGIKGTARVEKLPDGEYGLYVETRIDKTREDFDELKYRLDNDFLDSFSIEYIAPEDADYDEKVGARLLDDSTELYGWTLASQPMNEHAVMVKELFKEVSDMENEETKTPNKDLGSEKENNDEEQVKVSGEQDVSPKEYDEEEEEKKKSKKKDDMEKEETQDSNDKKEDVNMDNPKENKEISEEDKKLLQEAKEKKENEQKEKEFNEMKEKLFAEFKEQLKTTKVEDKTMNNDNKENMESKEIKNFKEAVFNKKGSVKESAAKLADSLGLLNKNELKTSKNIFDRKYNVSFDNGKIEMKGLGISTNQPSDTDYLLSAAELNDVFDPVIYNTLNQKTVFWNILQKDDFSNKGNNLVQFSVKDTANSTAGAYTGNAVTTGNVGREKLQTKFKKYQAGVQVDGDMIAAARGGPVGDVFAQEVEDSTVDLLSQINQDIFAENGAESDAELIGLPYLSDASGNTTLYNLTRSSYGFMDGNSGATYINASSADISVSLLRQAIRQAVEDAGSELDDLVFVCDWTQLHKFYGIYDSIQRTAPTSSRFGFEGRPEIDGIPIFADKDCKSGSWFLVDLRYGYRVGMWVPPTLEMLGKDSDSQKGFIKTYFATYSRNPNSVVEIYGAATS